MTEHGFRLGYNTNGFAHHRLPGAPLRPVEQLRERRPQSVPDRLDRFDFQPEGLGQRLLGKPRIDPDAELAQRQLQQRVSS